MKPARKDKTTMDLKGSHRFTARYDDAMMLDAIRIFVWRRAVVEQKVMWIVSALMAICSVYFLFWGGAGWMPGVILVLALLPLVFVSIVWRGQKATTFGRYKHMGEPKADITVDAGGIGITSGLGSDRIAWDGVTEVWERPRAFLVFCGDGEFNTLPSETMPEKVRAYLRARPRQEPADGPVQG
jgi:hypothetical protein